MGMIVFSLLVVAHLAFMYMAIGKMPVLSQALAERLINILPAFDGGRADMKGFVFCCVVMLWVAICKFRLSSPVFPG